jgi:hypothetical protein
LRLDLDFAEYGFEDQFLNVFAMVLEDKFTDSLETVCNVDIFDLGRIASRVRCWHRRMLESMDVGVDVTLLHTYFSEDSF